MKEITNIISTLRIKIIALNRVRALCIYIAALCVFLAGVIATDYVIHWPWLVRTLILFCGILICVRVFQNRFWPLWKQQPQNTSIAIRLEETEIQLKGLLASSVDFEAQNIFDQDPLAMEVTGRAKSILKNIRIARHIQTKPAIHAVLMVLCALAAWSVMFLLQPQITVIALERTVLPWNKSEWPPRLYIHSEITNTYAAKGETLLLKARADENQKPIKGIRVHAICEVVEKNGNTSIHKLEMAEQSDGSWEKTFVAEGETLNVSFVIDEFRTNSNVIHVVEPPDILGAKLSITPPQYAANKREKIEIKWDGATMPTLPAVLAGATAQLQINLSTEVVPTQTTNGEIDTEWLTRTIRPGDVSSSSTGQKFIYAFKVQSPTQWMISWTLNEDVDLIVDPIDQNGIRGREALRAQIQVVLDQAPTVVVVEPEQDEVVTKTATITTTIQAKDDLVLESIGLQLDRQQRSGEPQPKKIESKEISVDQIEGEFKSTLELRGMELNNGDTLLLRGTAGDLYEEQGNKRKKSISEPRFIRVVDQDVFEKKIRQETNNLRQIIARIEVAQKEAMNETESGNKSQSQKSLSDRIDQAQQTAGRIINRLDQNGMKDSNIADAMREVDEQASLASKHSQTASQELRQAAEGKQDAIHKATQEQAKTLKAIQAMLEVIDQDDESLGAQQRTDKLAETISKLRKDLAEIARNTAGKNTEELSTEDQAQLRGQAEKQRAASQEVRALLEDLQERSQRTKEKDRSLSEALQSALNEGQRGGAEKKMQEAADRSDKNQTGAADDSMQGAAETIEKIKNALKSDRQAKKEELKRRLSSLIETIRELVNQTENVQGLLDTHNQAIRSTQVETEKKCELVARNTSAATEESKSGGRATEATTKLLERASGFQDAVVQAMRNAQPLIDPAKEASSRALELLKEALVKTESLKKNQDEQELEKERDELAKKYMEYASVEKSIRQEVARILPPDGNGLDRRAVATSREMSQRQETLRENVSDILNKTETTKESPVFVKTHQLIDDWMKASRDQMSETTPTFETVALLDFTIESLQGLSAALTDPEQKDEPFSNNQSQNGGGEGEDGGGAGKKKKIPPIAELRLIRELQAQINRRTKIIEDTDLNSPGVAKAIADLSQLQETVRMLGEDWIQRMKKMSSQENSNPQNPDTNKKDSATNGIGFVFNNDFVLAFVAQSNTQQATQTPASTDEKSNSGTATPPPTKTLDELLGIAGSGGEKAAQAQQKERLEQGLQESSLQDLADAAMADMKLAQQLFDKDRDLGMGTQRVQAQALSRLDALIEAAVKFEKSPAGKSKPSKSKKDTSESGSSKKPGGDETKDEANAGNKDKSDTAKNADGTSKETAQRNNNGNPGDEINPPEFMDAQAQGESEIDESRTEWGHLPKRIREIMSQSRRDRISALYQKATEAYYRRMAEERGP